jgi:hypothetical protein
MLLTDKGLNRLPLVLHIALCFGTVCAVVSLHQVQPSLSMMTQPTIIVVAYS